MISGDSAIKKIMGGLQEIQAFLAIFNFNLMA
jgi:hypothetical protein